MEPTGLREEVGGAFGTAALAGLVAAIAGGVLWGYIVRWSGYEVGVVAWGIGFATGSAVVLGARGSRGRPYQVLAVVLSLGGILLGKYLSFAWALDEALEDQGLPIDVPIFSRATWDAFIEAREDVWGLFDLLFVGLAIFSAWRIPAVPAPPPVQTPAETRRE